MILKKCRCLLAFQWKSKPGLVRNSWTLLLWLALLTTHNTAAHSLGTIATELHIASTPSASFTSDVHIVMDWNKDHCGTVNNTKLPPMPTPFCALSPSRPGCDDDNIDSMPRVWFDQLSGLYRQLHSVNTNQGPSRPQIGESLTTLKHTCKAYTTITQQEDHVLNHFSDRVWVEAPYVLNKTHVYALTHVDSYPPLNVSISSVYSSLTLQISTNGGATFKQAFPAPHHLVATSPYDNRVNQFGINGLGLGMPSSIIKDPHSDYMYVMALANWGRKAGAQDGGQCLLRTKDITDAGSWRAWNGTGFSVSVNVSPLIAPVIDPDSHTCAILSTMPLRHISLLWSSYFEKFLAFGGIGSGLGFALSDDLITWSEVQKVKMENSGNGTITPVSPMPGKWVFPPKNAPESAHGWPYWIGAANATGQEASSGNVYKFKKFPCDCRRGPCEACPGMGMRDVCKLATNISSAEWAAVPESTVHFSCALVSKLAGYYKYLYATLVDDSEHRRTGADPSLNVVGQTATVFFVAEKCAGTTLSHNNTKVQCNMQDPVRHFRRDVVRATIKFQKGQ